MMSKTRQEAAGEAQPKARRANGRPAVLTRERILDEARQVPARELTMPVVARRLGVNPAALYYHFDSRDALLAALGERLAVDFQLREPDPGRWREWLLDAATELHRFLLANPVILAVEDWSRVARIGLPLVENVLETLERAGFGTEEAWSAWSVVSNYAYSNARTLHDAPRFRAAAATVSAEEQLSQAGRPLPRTLAAITLMSGRDAAQTFHGTLRWLIGILPEPGKAAGRRAAGRATKR